MKNEEDKNRTAESGEVIIRPMKPGEAESVAQIELHVFPDPWTAHSLLDMLSEPHSMYLVAEKDGQIVGYCGSRIVLDEGDILRVAIEEDSRGQKIGTAMLSYLIGHTPDVTSWNLDVREHNQPALGLYRKFGFVPVGRRKGYYSHPKDDAILMQRMR